MRTLVRNLLRTLIVLPGLAGFGDPPKDVGLVERAERSLVQLIVRIRPHAPNDRELAAQLTKDDFSILLDQKEIPPAQFELDNFCPQVGGELSPEPQVDSKHLLFFVDQLGLEGQDNTKMMLQRMIPQMAADGYQMKVLPNPEAGWTEDVGRLAKDAEALFDPSKPSRENRDDLSRSHVRALLEGNQVEQAIAVARESELAAQLTFEGPTLQLARAISDMGALPSPKALIYFAELGHSFNEFIVDTALRSGVAVYAVKADGMAPYDPTLKTANDPGAIITTSLSALADHTGGRFAFGGFRKGASDKIVERVQSDLSCVYVLSLDAAGLDRDRTIRPKIKLKPYLKSHLTAATIPELTIPSEKRRQQQAVAIALRSVNWPGVQQAVVSLTPLGFDASKATALIQFSLSAGVDAPSVSTAWDVGVNYFGAFRVSGFGSMRVTSTSSKIVFEKIVRLPVGPYSIVGMAQEVGGSGLARGTAAGVLARPKNNAVGFLHPLDLMQWQSGTYVSEKANARKTGWSPLRFGMAASDRPIALVTSVCRGASVHGRLTIEKSLLLPDRELHAPSTTWTEQGSPCRVVRDDVLRAGELPWSNQPYEATLVVSVNDTSRRTIAKTSKAFWVVGPNR